MAQTTEVVTKESAQLPATMDFLDGLVENEEGEQLSRDDVSIPFLRILQSLSPQVDADDGAYIEGAKPGMILNTVTGELFDKDTLIEFIPVTYKASYIEWVPRKLGGGMVAEYSLAEAKAVADACVRDDNNNDVIQKGAPEPFTEGNHLLFTHTHVVRYKGKDGNWRPAVISMTKTQLKPSRQLNAILQENPVRGKVVRYLHLMTAKTQLVSKGDDKWYIWHFDRKGWADEASILAARDFQKAVMGGEVKVDMAKSVDDDDVQPAAKPSAKPADQLDDEIPF